MEYSGHAQVAYEHGALRVLTQLGQSGQQVADAAMSGLHSTILMPLLSGMVAAFGMSPTSLPQEDLSHMLQLFWAVYEGESPDHTLCTLTVPADACKVSTVPKVISKLVGSSMCATCLHCHAHEACRTSTAQSITIPYGHLLGESLGHPAGKVYLDYDVSPKVQASQSSALSFGMRIV